jgi:hypothetical protein
MPTDMLEYNIKIMSLDHARSIQGHHDTANVVDLIKDAKKIEKYIREGMGG